MPYSSIQELITLKQRILQLSTNDRSTTNIQVLNIDDVLSNIIHVYRVKDSFVLNDRIHIIYLDKKFTFEDDYIHIFFQRVRESYTSSIKNDKLIIPCLLPIDRYCPICSFHTSIVRLLRYHILHNRPDEFVESNIELYEILSLLNRFNIFFSEILYNVQIYYIPCIVSDNIDMEKLSINILKLNKKQMDLLVSTLINHLKDNHTSINDISYFSFRVIPIEQNTTFEIIDIDERNIPDNVSVRLSELKPRIHSLDFSFLYRSRENLDLSSLVNILDDILDNIYKKIELML